MITAFYSFKGGVGRTLSVVHVARRLARALAREEAGDLLVVDLDLEAPGLDGYLGREAHPSCGGLARLFADLQRKPAEARPAWLRKAFADKRYVVTHPTLPLRYLPSGLGDIRTPGASYSALAAMLREVIDEADGGTLAALREALSAAATYVLVDSRTGLADESYLSTVLLPDAIVLLFRPSRLHLDGVEQVYRNFLARKGLEPGDPRAPVVPVVSPLPNRGGTDIAAFLTKEVARVFRWRWTAEPSVDEKRDAPLERLGSRRFVRLYAEPALDLGDTTLVDEEGNWLPGFDKDTPLPQGYHRLVDRLRALNFRDDWRGADRLARFWSLEGEDTLAAIYLVERIRQRFTTDDAIVDYALADAAILTVLCPALERLTDEPHVAAALAQAAALLVSNTEVEGEPLVRAVEWAGAAPNAAAAHLPVYALASRFQQGVGKDARDALAGAVGKCAAVFEGVEGSQSASRAGLASLLWTLGAVDRAAEQLARIDAAVFTDDDPDGRAALSMGAPAGWGLGAVPFAARVIALSTGADAAELLAAGGWPTWARAADDQAEAGLLEARQEEPPLLGAELPEPRAEVWLATVLRGGIPVRIPKDARQSEPARTVAMLAEAPPTKSGQRTYEISFPATDRNLLGWQFARAWIRESLETGPVGPPNVSRPYPLSVALFDAFRMGLYAGIRRDVDTVEIAADILAEIVEAAPGLGAVTRRMDGIRAPLLAAFHLHRLGRIDASIAVLVGRIRAPLDADPPLPEPPLGDLAAGYAPSRERLADAARLATDLPERLVALHERVKRLYVSAGSPS